MGLLPSIRFQFHHSFLILQEQVVTVKWPLELPGHACKWWRYSPPGLVPKTQPLRPRLSGKDAGGHSGTATWACFWLMDIRPALQPWNPMYPGLRERKSTNIFRYLQTPSWYGPPGAGSPHPAPMWVAGWGATWCWVAWSERSLPSFIVKRCNSIFYGNSEIIEVEILKLELEKCWNQITHSQLLQ